MARWSRQQLLASICTGIALNAAHLGGLEATPTVD